jgi:hypothetical protein
MRAQMMKNVGAQKARKRTSVAATKDAQNAYSLLHQEGGGFSLF